MVPLHVAVKDAPAQVAAAVLLLEDALPLCLRWAAALCSQQRAEDPLGYTRKSLSPVLELVAQLQLG